MNFFHRIFAKEKNSARANNGPFFEQLEFRKSDWLDVFSVCLGKMYVIQSAVGKTVIGDSDWEVDFEHGLISLVSCTADRHRILGQQYLAVGLEKRSRV